VIDAMAVRIGLAEVEDLHQVLEDHARYRGGREVSMPPLPHSELPPNAAWPTLVSLPRR
jgi:hypothetical protein